MQRPGRILLAYNLLFIVVLAVCLLMLRAQTPGRSFTPLVVVMSMAVVGYLLPVVCSLLFKAWRARDKPSGYCTRCAYDLRGNVSGKCPECGTAIVVG